MLSAEALRYTARAIVQQMAGNKQKVTEYCGYIKKAIEINKVEPKWMDCKYWHNGEKVSALINWNTGEIKSTNGEVLRRGNNPC